MLESAFLAAVPRRDPQAGWSQPTLSAVIHATRPVLLSTSDSRLPPPGPARGGARLLELISACPFRAGAEFRLHARALEEPAPGLSPAERGEMVHGVLARLWAILRDQAGLNSLTDAALGAPRSGLFQALMRMSTPAGMLRLESASTVWLVGSEM